jgi:hypothetical protein
MRQRYYSEKSFFFQFDDCVKHISFHFIAKKGFQTLIGRKLHPLLQSGTYTEGIKKALRHSV